MHKFLFPILISTISAESPLDLPGQVNVLKPPAETTLSSQCLNDSATWGTSLKEIAITGINCIVNKNCTEAEKSTLIKNLFAARQLNAFGLLPGPGVLDIDIFVDGSYSECEEADEEAPYSTNYCYLLLGLGKNSSCGGNIYVNYLKRAVCMPRSCDESDLSLLYNTFTLEPFTACGAICVKKEIPKNTWFWFFTVFLIFMAIIVVFATLMDYLRESLHGIKSDNEPTYLIRLLYCFSMYTNAEILLSVKEPKEGHIKSLDCIRFLSMSWVLAGHSMAQFAFSDDLWPITKVPKKWINETFLNAFLSVDTFFVLSGVVLAYVFFKNKPKLQTVKNPVVWIMFYVHRYLRLTPPMMIFIGFFVAYAPFIRGPWTATTANVLIPQVEICKTQWWRNLIYINNFKTEDMCLPPYWYLALDTQLYVISPIFLIALCFSSVFGVLTLFIACVVSVGLCYAVMFKYSLAPTFLSLDTNLDFVEKLYVVPWIRATSYLIGIFAGFILAKVGGKRVKLNLVLIVFGWLAAVSIACACLYGVSDYHNGANWSPLVKATYYNFHRIGWSLAVSWVIIANHLGWGGPINNFISHPIWQPFGRLAYCAYLVHWLVIYYFFNLLDRPAHFISLWQIYLHYVVPLTFITYFCAFFWSSFFEIPTFKLQRMLMDTVTKKIKNNSSNKSETSTVSTSWDIPTPLHFSKI